MGFYQAACSRDYIIQMPPAGDQVQGSLAQAGRGWEECCVYTSGVRVTSSTLPQDGLRAPPEATPRSSASSPVQHTHLRKFPRTATAYRVGVVVQDRADPRLTCGPSAEDVKVRPPTLWRSRASTVVSRDHDRDCLSNGVSHLMPPPQNKQN